MPDNSAARGTSPSHASRYLAALACGSVGALCALLLGAGPAGWIFAGAASGLAALLARPALAFLSRPSRSKVLCDALKDRGADFASFSAFDGKAIGYDVARSAILVATDDAPAGIGIVEHPLDRVRSVTWQVPATDPSATYAIGPASFAGASQASAMNAEARRQALSRSGLAIELAAPVPQVLRVCLDADEGRLRRWTEILDQARAGSIAKPGTAVIV
jgi:hypothetical protein